MQRIMRRLAVAMMLLAVSATNGHGWYSYAQVEDAALEEIPIGSETLAAGTIIAYLPNGARSVIVEQIQYFISGGNWFLPVVNAEGVKYQVVFAPM